MKRDNIKFFILSLISLSFGMLFIFFIHYLFNKFSGLYPFLGIACVFLPIGFSSLIFFLLEKKIDYIKLKKVFFIILVLILGILPFVIKYDIGQIFLIFIFVVFFVMGSLFLLIHRSDIKDSGYKYYFSFVGFAIGIGLYFLIGYLFSFFISLLFLFIILIFSTWYFSYRKNIYFLLFFFVVLSSVFINTDALNNDFYGNFYIKDIKEDIFSKDTVDVKGVFVNNDYYTFYFPRENFEKFKGSLYELIYSKIMDKPSLLVINGGGGIDVAAGIYFNLKLIDVIEKNPKVIEHLKDSYSTYTGGIYHNRNVMYYRSETFPFLVSSNKKYNIIQVTKFFYKDEPLVDFSIEYIKLYHSLIEKNGIIVFFIRGYDNYTVSVLINTISNYLIPYRKTLYETVRVIKLKNNNYAVIFKPDAFSQDLNIINDFCTQNSYSLLTADKFIDKNTVRKMPNLRDNRSFTYSLFFYDLKTDFLNLKTFISILIFFILLFLIYVYIVLNKKKELKNVYVSSFILYFVFSLTSVGLFIPSFVYKIWVLFENTSFIFSLMFFAISFFTILFYLALKYKVKLNRTSIFVIHSIFLLSLIIYIVFFDSLASLVASYGFIFRVFVLLIVYLPLFISCFSFVFFSIEWGTKINENTFFLSIGNVFVVFGISFFLGCLVNLFLSFDIVWIFTILLQAFALLTFLKLDIFYRKNNYMYRRYGI